MRKAEHGGTGTSHSRAAPGTTRAISVDKAGLLFLRLQTRRFVSSVTRSVGAEMANRLTGPVAEAPDAGVRDMARSGR